MHNNADNILFRASGIGNIMTREGNVTEGLKSYLAEVFVQAKYNRRKDISSKYLSKGNIREDDAITLLSRVNKTLYTKNTERLKNDFTTGECDIFVGEEVRKATETLDTKCSWDAITFATAKAKPLDKAYKYQGYSYMWLTGAQRHTVAYCLVNGTPQQILSEKNRAKWQFVDDCIDVDVYEPYLNKCKEIEKNHIFDMGEFMEENPHFDLSFNLDDWKYDIPFRERVHQKTFFRDELEIAKMTGQVMKCRDWINKNLFI